MNQLTAIKASLERQTRVIVSVKARIKLLEHHMKRIQNNNRIEADEQGRLLDRDNMRIEKLRELLEILDFDLIA